VSERLQNLQYDTGPHSLTRVVLVHKLREAALSAPSARRMDALRVLRLMNERGQIEALSCEPGQVGSDAAQVLGQLSAATALSDQPR
jgi:hypothetical protein